MPTSTSIQSIPQINLSSSSQSFEAGMFDNAYIKSLNIDIGLTDDPTSINIGLINELGRYRDYGLVDPATNQSSLNYLDPYELRIGDQLNIWCYLITQKKSISSSSKTTELEFVDGSHILDRVFVGGIGVHIDPNNNQFSNQGVGVADIPVACPPCYTNNQIGILDPNHKEIFTGSSTFYPFPDPRTNHVSINPIYTQRALRSANKNVIGDSKNGGYIFLGDEKFTRTSCEIPTVDYSFQDLKDACLNLGIEIGIDDPSYNPDNNIHALRKSHWGTLRKVLKDWCGDFGVSFYYDYSSLKPTIREVDLKSNVLGSKIAVISNLAKTINSGSSALVESIDETKTIKGSFKNNLITTYKRPRVKRNFSKNVFYGTAFKCFQAVDILSTEAMNYRSHEQFNTSCYLAKYNQNVRTLYLSRIAGEKWRNSGYTDGSMYKALGFAANFQITGALKHEIIDECLNTETYREITSNFTAAGLGISDFDMILGSYSEEEAGKHAEFEKSFAEDFIGKYFFSNFNTYADSNYGGYQQCFTGADWRYKIESSITPEIKPIFTSVQSTANATNLQSRLYNQQKLPFAKNLWGAIPKNFWTFYDWFSDARLKIFQRSDAPWNTTQEQADRIFTDEAPTTSDPNADGEKDGPIDLTLPFLPRFQKIEGMIETRLRSRFGGTQIPIPQAVDNIKQKTVPCIMIAPRPEYLKQLLDVSPIVPAVNPAETPYWFSKSSGLGNKPNCDDSMACEIQEGLDKNICSPKVICAGYPTIPPQAVDTDSVGKIYAARDNDPFPEGILDQRGGGLAISFKPPIKGGQYPAFSELGPPRRINIIGPAGSFPNVNDIYLANYKESINSDYYSPKIEKFLGDKDLKPPKNVSEIKMTLNNVSSNDPIFSAKTFDPVTGTDIISVLTNIYIPGYGYLTIEDYHQYLQSFTEQGNEGGLKHDLTVKFGNIDFGAISQFFNSKNGLSSLSCNIESDGISTTASWTNRPATPPSQDLFIREVEPQLLARSNFV